MLSSVDEIALVARAGVGAWIRGIKRWIQQMVLSFPFTVEFNPKSEILPHFY